MSFKTGILRGERKKMDLKKWKRWEKLRKNGKITFIFVNGGLIGGLVIALAITLIGQLIKPNSDWVFNLLIYFIILTFIGILAAIFIWNKNEKKFMSENLPEPRRISHTQQYSKQYRR
jgi:polyferredoxin